MNVQIPRVPQLDSRTRIKVDVSIMEQGWPAELAGEKLERALENIVALSVDHLQHVPVEGCELSIVLTDDDRQRELNRQWRGKDSPTNVLSFAQIEPFAPLQGMLGDIILARQTLEREADSLEIPLSHHMAHLVVHGFLHILGYDHESDTQAATMEALETAILARMGIGDPYA